jgi:hypothetical protein
MAIKQGNIFNNRRAADQVLLCMTALYWVTSQTEMLLLQALILSESECIGSSDSGVQTQQVFFYKFKAELRLITLHIILKQQHANNQRRRVECPFQSAVRYILLDCYLKVV